MRISNLQFSVDGGRVPPLVVRNQKPVCWGHSRAHSSSRIDPRLLRGAASSTESVLRSPWLMSLIDRKQFQGRPDHPIVQDCALTSTGNELAWSGSIIETGLHRMSCELIGGAGRRVIISSPESKSRPARKPTQKNTVLECRAAGSRGVFAKQQVLCVVDSGTTG